MQRPAALALAALLALLASAQDPPSLVWQACYGGSGSESGRRLLPLPDGGMFMQGLTSANGGQVSGYHGGASDIWAVRLNATGGIAWQRCLGGSGTETSLTAAATTDGGFLIVGSTTSNDGDVSGNHGGGDAWVVKLSGDGQLLWQRCIGGSGSDVLYGVAALADGGFVAAGHTNSTDGDAVATNGSHDTWMVRLDDAGSILWSRTFGSSSYDVFFTMAVRNDGSFLAAGYTAANDGDVSGNHGLEDIWLACVSPAGELLWQRSYGGSGTEMCFGIAVDDADNAVLVGRTNSPDGDVTGANVVDDLWALKVDGTGELLWQWVRGGSGFDSGYCTIIRPDGMVLLAGSTLSENGDTGSPIGGADGWLLALSPSGALLWQLRLGGTDNDSFLAAAIGGDEELLLLGGTTSNNGHVSGNHGAADAWLARLSFFSSVAGAADADALAAYPCPAADRLWLRLGARWHGPFAYAFFDGQGRLAARGSGALANGEALLDVAGLAPGPYWLVAQGSGGIAAGQVVKGE